MMCKVTAVHASMILAGVVCSWQTQSDGWQNEGWGAALAERALTIEHPVKLWRPSVAALICVE